MILYTNSVQYNSVEGFLHNNLQRTVNSLWSTKSVKAKIVKVKVEGQYLERPEDAWAQVLITEELVINYLKSYKTKKFQTDQTKFLSPSLKGYFIKFSSVYSM